MLPPSVERQSALLQLSPPPPFGRCDPFVLTTLPTIPAAALAPEDSTTSTDTPSPAPAVLSLGPTAFTTSEVSDLLARLPEVFDLLTALKDLPTTLAGLIAQQADAHHKLKSQFDELDGRVNDLRMDHNTLEMAMQGSPLTAADQASFAADQDVIDKSNDDAGQEGDADLFVGQPAPSFSPVPVAASPGPLFSPNVATSAWPASSVAYALQAPQSPYQRAALHPASCDCETCWTARGFPSIPPSAPPTANVSVVPPTPSPAGSSASAPALLTARASTSPAALPTAGVLSASPPAHDQAAAAPAVYSPLELAHASSSQTPLSPSPPSANSSDASPPFDWDRPNANVESSSHTPLSSPPPSANSSDVSRAYDWNRPNANVDSSVASGDHPVFSVHAVSQPLPVSPSPPPASPSPPGSTGSSPDASVAPVLSLSQIRLSETAPAPVEETLHRRSRTTSN
jgi:hypothetical protein